jgi:DnaJ-domain-containing protein 1
MIELIFFICLFYVFGSFCSLFFREMNPLVILFGLFVLGFFVQILIEEKNDTHKEIAFLFGLVRHWFNPLTALRGGIRYGHLRDVLHFFKLDMGKQKQAFEAQQRQAEEDLNKQREQMQREKTNFQQEKARFHQQKQQQDSKQSQQERAPALNPNRLDDAYEVLGVPQGAGLKQCKSAYRSLMGIYHPDKRAKLTGSRKQEAEEQAVLINVAWDTVKKALG